jgi:hypothetical protein
MVRDTCGNVRRGLNWRVNRVLKQLRSQLAAFEERWVALLSELAEQG